MKKVLKIIGIIGCVLGVLTVFLGIFGGNADEHTEEPTNQKENDLVDEAIEPAENIPTSEQEKEIGLQDGVSSDYLDVPFGVDTDIVIEEFHQKGYNYVYLNQHEIHTPENNNIEGTTDTIYLDATYFNEKFGYTYTDHYGVIYSYWGENLGWKNNYEMLDVNANREEIAPDFNPGNFSDVYIHMSFDEAERISFEMLVPWKDYGIEFGDDTVLDFTGDTPIDYYIHIENLDGLQYLRDQSFGKDEREFGELIMVYDDIGYVADLRLNELKILGKDEIVFTVNDTEISSGVSFYIDENTTFIDAEEYEAARQGTVAPHEPKIEANDMAIHYGVYICEDDSYIMTCEISHASDDDYDYLTVTIMEKNNENIIAYFWGTDFEYQGDNIYNVTDIESNTKLESIFDDLGVNIRCISSADNLEMEEVDGYYVYSDEINYENAS